MNFDAKPMNIPEALSTWGLVFGSILVASLAIGFILALVLGGKRGIPRFFENLGEGLTDLIRMSPKRVGAIANLTLKEAIRRKALLVFVVFAVLFMFGGWFLSNTNSREELQLSVYVSFVLTSIGWLIFPVALILACWGLPEDIRLRSLHTVVTKPVRRSEIVLGRILGFVGVGTFVVGIMSVLGYVWIIRQVPENVKSRLIARVPVYGSLDFRDRQGEEAESGVNTGDINPYRSYIEGASKARAKWTFDGLSPSDLQIDPETGKPALLVENSFQAFRTHKGVIDEVLHGQYTLVNPETDLRVSLPQFPVYEFRQNLAWIPEELEYYNEETQQTETRNLFDDLVVDGKLAVEARCVDVGQFLGMARPDLFIRLPDRPFASSYFKSVFGIWMMMVLIVVLGVTASTFVKGPVATILLFTLILVGTGFNQFMNDILSGEVRGAGLIESGIRILNHGNPIVEKPDSLEESVAVQNVDQVFTGLLWGISHVIPNFNIFSFKAYTANGFDVPMMAAVMPAVFMVLGFFIPCLILGYYSLKLRELEAK
ncbi:MAG: ABC transporter permease [Planctomycetaceae bacterium]|nr:ABC transporter permease [Planctomycetaceae bacterium]